MKRIRLTVAYDGTAYCGWQVQPGKPTIEGELNRCLSELTKEEIQIIGASRTDSGVHAYGNLAVFDSNTSIPPERIPYALNQKLPCDIRVQKGEEVSSSFHPRRDVIEKTYEYRIDFGSFPLPTHRLYSYYTYKKPDSRRMQEAASYLIGEHDFTSFCSAKTEKENKVRTITKIEILEQGRELIIRISGNGFLYNMVRILAGTLLKVGEGQLQAAQVQRILQAKDRTKAGPTLPPQGLFLIEIKC